MSAQQSAAGPSHATLQTTQRVPLNQLQQQQQLHSRNPAQIYNYQQQQQVAAARNGQPQPIPRRHSYAQPNQPHQVQQDPAISQSSSAPHVPTLRSATFPTLANPPANVIDLTMNGAGHTPTASPSSSRPTSANYPPQASSTHPQSPSAFYNPAYQYQASPMSQTSHQFGQPSIPTYTQQTARTATDATAARYTVQTHQPAYQPQQASFSPASSSHAFHQPTRPAQAQRQSSLHQPLPQVTSHAQNQPTAQPRPSQTQPQQRAPLQQQQQLQQQSQQQRPQPQPQSHPQSLAPSLSRPQPQVQPQSQQQSTQQAQAQQSGEQPNTRVPPPSTHARAHAMSVLQATGSYLEHAYRAGVLLVAHEFDKLNENMTALTTENKRLVAENTRLTDAHKEADEERGWLRQERHRLLEDVAKAQQQPVLESGDESEREVKKRLLEMCQVFEAAAKHAAAENAKLKKANEGLVRLLYLSRSPNTSLVPEADLALVPVGPYSAPKGMVDALKEAIVQEYEEKLATGLAERQKLAQRSAMLESLLRIEKDAPAAQPAAGPSTSTTTAPAVPLQPTADGPITRPASTSFVLPASLSRRRTPPDERRSASEQPSSQRTDAPAPSVHSIPTPPRTATPLDAPDAAAASPAPDASPAPVASSAPVASAEPIVKAEPVDEERRWPWAAGEIIDLTGLDTPPRMPSVDLGALELQLARELTQVAEGPEGERKRSLSSAPEDEDGCRKRARLDGGGEEGGGDGGGQEQGALPQPGEAPTAGAGAQQAGEDAMQIDASSEAPQPAIATIELPAGLPAFHDPLVSPGSPKAADGPAASVSSHPLDATPDAQVSAALDIVHPSEPLAGASNLLPADSPLPAADAGAAEPMVVDGAPAPDAAPQAEDTGTVPGAPVKDEPDSSPARRPSEKRLGIRHFDLVYHTSKTEMTCRMCYKRKEDMDPNWRVQRFPISAPWPALERHCMEVHPVGYESLINLSTSTLVETRERLLALDHAGAHKR
ncbi:hypothetical protein PsYK624_105140 [Phanerochaete sordida]|uniref:Uncharacterized protein n=1 Tax=Phanerochaete sordida TaxID=48140 RepID=A0A9P3LGH9_9APHY|nr:hypothetical protein PsYK624_105140 [Phanerochaete sordida]